jgi:hypothetical protein|tara:strand:- start:1838 stop:2053 length:216 start_codon:yes stop_codon:yes gene_type:complete
MDQISISNKDKQFAERALQFNKHLSYLCGKSVNVNNKKLTICGLKEGRLLLTNNTSTFKVPIPDVVEIYNQ